MILRIPAAAVALLAAAAGHSAAPSAEAFQCRPTTMAHRHHRLRSLAPPPRMSSIPDDNDDATTNGNGKGNNNPLLEKISNFSLPPAPEDTIALSGDVVALFVYSYLDHGVQDLYAEAAKVDNVADLVALSADGTGPGVPVWFDPADLASHGTSWLARTVSEAPYAPAIAHPGLAFVALSTAWILCGWLFTGAFLSRNTLECDPPRALTVALRTWAGTCCLVVLLALGSDAAWGTLDGINALSAPARGGLTKADADFIFDSLSVLAFWRFMFNWLLGYR